MSVNESQISERTALPKVLVVDDVPANLRLVAACLETLDCQVALSGSGTDALRRLLREEFAVLLLDVQMPGMDGYELARYARESPRTRDVPIVFVTAANPDDEKVLSGYGVNAVDFVFKPVNPTVLRSKVRVFLELYESRRALASVRKELETAYAELDATRAKLVQSTKMDGDR